MEGEGARLDAKEEATMALARESPVRRAESRRGCRALYVAVMLALESAAEGERYGDGSVRVIGIGAECGTGSTGLTGEDFFLAGGRTGLLSLRGRGGNGGLSTIDWFLLFRGEKVSRADTNELGEDSSVLADLAVRGTTSGEVSFPEPGWPKEETVRSS